MSSRTETESIVEIGADWERVVIAQIVDLDRHPNADNLLIAKVERGAGYARAIAANLSNAGHTALIASIDEGRAHLCFSRPKGAGPSMNELLKEALALLSGKGGGSADFAQGSGDPARLDEALAAARARV